MNQQTFSVSEVNNQIKNLVETRFNLITIKGENSKTKLVISTINRMLHKSQSKELEEEDMEETILESIEVVVKQYNEGKIPTIIDDYNVDNVSQKVIKIIFSYIDYVNRNVWRKDSSKKST